MLALAMASSLVSAGRVSYQPHDHSNCMHMQTRWAVGVLSLCHRLCLCLCHRLCCQKRIGSHRKPDARRQQAAGCRSLLLLAHRRAGRRAALIRCRAEVSDLRLPASRTAASDWAAEKSRHHTRLWLVPNFLRCHIRSVKSRSEGFQILIKK
jgi:hypothetical protein